MDHTNETSVGFQKESVNNFMEDHIKQNQLINSETEILVERLEAVFNRFKQPEPSASITSAGSNLNKQHVEERIPDGVDCLNYSNQHRRDLNSKLSYLVEKIESLI